MCPAEEFSFDLSGVPELDDACGAGTSTGLDPSAEEYIAIIDDIISLLEESDLSIPAAEVGNVCEVQQRALCHK